MPNDKPEGLAMLADGRLAVVNDNDFGVTGLDASAYNALTTLEKAKYSLASDIGGSQTYVYAKGADAKTQLGIISFTPTGIDPSDKDAKIALLNNQNIYGLRMPDGIAAFQALGKDGISQTFTVIANEGDTRVRPDGDYTVNGTTTKDSTVFVDELRSGVTGTGTDNRLKIITDLGNYDATTAAYEQKFVFGGRSISILDSLGNVIWDSGDAIDKAAIAAGTYDDTRSDDKGSEPENVTVATVDGKTYAFVALERSGGVVSFEITDPYNASLVSYNKSATGVVSPEGIIVIPADKSPNGRTLLVTSNEVSKQLEVLAQDYTLQLLHYYGESGLLGVKTAPIMGALIDRFDDQYANTWVIGEGDSFIPGPWLVGGADPSLNGLSALGDTSSTDTKSDGVTALGRPDVAIMNLFGTNVSALGNHEFDLGSPVLSSAIAASGNWKGAQFPLITSNLNFSADSSLKGLADSSLGGTATNAFAGKEASDIKSKIAPYTVVTKGGEKIGIVGATTWNLLEKSSPNGTKVLDDANDATSDLQEVAAYVQASVDKLILAGVNKIIMIDQLDGMIDRNKALAPLLKGVDVMVAGGGHERHGDSTDTAVPFNGHDANFIPEGYPLVVKDADGKDTLIVTSDTEYSYLGRLVVRFDSNGNVIVPDLNPAINGAYASTEASLQAAYGSTKTSAQIISSSTIGMAVGDIANAIDNVIASKDGAIYGYTSVYLEGDRVYGRAQEVNLGNLSADANLYAASRILPAGTVLGSLKNGGGIRASIGSVNADGTKLRPAETSVKSTGAISQLEVENALRFDNKLMVFDTNPTGLLAILNYAAGLSAGNGGYAQIGGVRFSFDPTKEAGKKVQDVAVYDLGGNLLAKVADNGVILASAPKTITLSTLNFMAQGGDGYPIKANGENFRYLLSNSNAFHGTPETAYTTADTIQSVDQRIQSLGVKPLDTVFPDSNIRLFNSGVASGDPYADSVILWTRIDPANTFSSSVAVDWEVFTSPTFSTNSIIDKGTFTTNKDRDWTVKVEADGLNPDTTYYYRFRVGDVVSMVGQTKTLPVDSGAVHLAVFSCANFPAADTFAAYGRAAAINAVNPYDAWVHLGDYIYEYGPGGYGVAESAASTRGYSPNREIVSLDDYRQRYAQYHSDSNAIWDDHETANDSYAEGAENHQPLTEGEWIARRDAALQAYYEWVPIREPLLRDGTDQGTVQTPLTKGYRSFDFGDVLSLHVLETRLTARDKQLAYPDATAVQTRLGAILQSPSSISAYATKYGVAAPTSAADATRFATALAPYVTNELVAAVVGEAYAANREMMGKEELDWLKSEMATSQARWQVLGQQVLMQSMAVPAELLLNAGNPALLDKYAAPLQKLATGTAFTALSAAEQALFSEAGKIPYNLDAWDGYGLERETILQSALAMGKRLISLAGDTHNAWAGVLDTMAAGIKPAGTVAGVEFATPGVTSPGFEKYLPGADAYIRAKYPAVDGLDGLFTGYVNGLKYADLNRRGFLDLTITPDQAVGNFQLLNGVDQTSGIASWSSETVAASANFSLRLNGAPSGISLVNATSYLAENTSTTSRTKV
ncbi:MAG: alkaline phosphatase D family protein, partial [Cyanobium sp. LacPavin_0920_WC12_MAG_62_9]|nr:alkaline phosphatase D family protein [Cyanobium sp. LacPavin_0920_WC12_MAG_62_9]